MKILKVEISDIQDYFTYVIKKHDETVTSSLQ